MELLKDEKDVKLNRFDTPLPLIKDFTKKEFNSFTKKYEITIPAIMDKFFT